MGSKGQLDFFLIIKKRKAHGLSHFVSEFLSNLSKLIIIVDEEYTDPHQEKMTREEYPILTDTQQGEREQDKVSFD
ncbi:hypothetical protein KFZ58_14535 [Virgibacillus sp. NKC19-16]|uniref:hypothetical protein n=1 Tax=Virgibacillus salidurans TaxID=2831673 RepID=UPI001F24F8EB|nr:hypothetical protein [Virgibacillus sp. NKC19-16]UJL45603.1 hypothetical protein KFZ58_14535 [Virgibacillus sp. NKC19-16]